MSRLHHRALAAAAVAALLAAAAGGPATAAVPEERPAAPGAPSADAVPDELLVGYVDGAGPAQRERARGRAAAQLAEVVVPSRAGRKPVELVRLPAGKDRQQAIAELQGDPTVAYAEPNWVLTHQAVPTELNYSNGPLWGMYGDLSTPKNEFGSQAAEAWARGNVGSAGVYVGVIDEGIQLTHPDLAGQVWKNPFDAANDRQDNDGNGYVDDVNGWDFDGNDKTVYDGGSKGSFDDHGTHVAGTIGAKANNDGVVGVNHQITLISGKFLGGRGGTLANAVKAVDYFTDLKTRHKLNIVATNNSWGGGAFSQTMLDAINRGGAAGILFIAAAGNGGSDGVGDDNDAVKSYPSGYQCNAGGVDCVVAVAAINSSGGLASFSNYGASSVDLGAPGVGVLSTTAFNGYSSYNGTSMATPHVTGAAALYKASHPLATAAEIKAALITNAAPTASLDGKAATNGRLDASGF